MKKHYRLISAILALTFVLSMQSVAFGLYIYEEDSKSTPYGDMYGTIGRSGTTPDYVWLFAQTSIDSDYTMAETVVKMEAQYTDTGDIIDSDSDRVRDDNFAECFVDVPTSTDVTVFTTHEVTYTRSYVLYMSCNI